MTALQHITAALEWGNAAWSWIYAARLPKRDSGDDQYRDLWNAKLMLASQSGLATAALASLREIDPDRADRLTTQVDELSQDSGLAEWSYDAAQSIAAGREIPALYGIDDTDPEITTTVSEYTVNAVPASHPESHRWEITVTRQRSGKWLATCLPRVLDPVIGGWNTYSHEDRVSCEMDEATALRLARDHAPTVLVNGASAADVARDHREEQDR